MAGVFDKVIYSPSVIEFVTVASEYCGFLERINNFERSAFIDKSQKLLTLLYLKATLIPHVDTVVDTSVEKFVGENDYEYVRTKIVEKLGAFDVFVEVEESIMVMGEGAISISLSEIFADIYQELKDFVLLYQIGNEESMNDGLWECMMNFKQNWGNKLLAALCGIHPLIYGIQEE